MERLKEFGISEKRGTEKHEVREAMGAEMDWGIEGDAHGGKSGIVRSVCFPMKRFRNFVQKGQKLRMVHLVKI